MNEVDDRQQAALEHLLQDPEWVPCDSCERERLDIWLGPIDPVFRITPCAWCVARQLELWDEEQR